MTSKLHHFVTLVLWRRPVSGGPRPLRHPSLAWPVARRGKAARMAIKPHVSHRQRHYNIPTLASPPTPTLLPAAHAPATPSPDGGHDAPAMPRRHGPGTGATQNMRGSLRRAGHLSMAVSLGALSPSMSRTPPPVHSWQPYRGPGERRGPSVLVYKSIVTELGIACRHWPSLNGFRSQTDQHAAKMAGNAGSRDHRGVYTEAERPMHSHWPLMKRNILKTTTQNLRLSCQ